MSLLHDAVGLERTIQVPCYPIDLGHQRLYICSGDGKGLSLRKRCLFACLPSPRGSWDLSPECAGMVTLLSPATRMRWDGDAALTGPQSDHDWSPFWSARFRERKLLVPHIQTALDMHTRGERAR